MGGGTTRSTLMKWERGQHQPSEPLLDRYAEATGQPRELFSDDEDEEAASQAMASELTHVLTRMVAAEVARQHEDAPPARREGTFPW